MFNSGGVAHSGDCKNGIFYREKGSSTCVLKVLRERKWMCFFLYVPMADSFVAQE